MKKKNVLKFLAIIFLVYVVLTWIIPTGYFSNGQYVKDAITPIGLFDIVKYPIITSVSTIFLLTGLIIVLIGGLYGVLNKTGAYQNLVQNISKKFKDKEIRFLIFTTLLFVLLSSLTGLNLPLFIMVPMFSTVLLLLGYNKITTMFATIGSILIGNVASTYGFNVAGYISYFTNNINDSIIYRIVLLILSTALLLFTVIKLGKEKVKVKAEEIILYEKESKNDKVSVLPMVIILVISLVIIMIGMINWTELFGIETFAKFHTNLTNVNINGYPIIANIIGSMNGLGSWTNYELATILVVITIIIGLVYRLSIKEFFESFKDGSKKVLPVAFYAIIVSTIFLAINATSTGYSIFPTIANWFFELTKEFNVIAFGFISFIGGIIYNDFPYLLSSLYDPIITNYSSSVSVMGIIIQSINGLVQIIAPTSVLLIIGLKYFDIDYKEWLKKSYKLVLEILAVVVVIVAIMSLI